MNKLIVGNENCSFARIQKAIEKSSAYSEIRTVHGSLRSALEIEDKDGKLAIIATGLILGLTTLPDFLKNILIAWKSEKTEQATLAALVAALKHINLNDFVTELEKEFAKEIEKASCIDDKKTVKQSSSSPSVPLQSSVTGSDEATMSGQAESNFDAVSESDEVYLDFGNVNVKHKVLRKMGPDMTNILHSKNINKSVLLELATIDDVFDSMEINELIAKRYDSERDRINDLLLLLHNKEADEIKVCLEKLCNLGNQPGTSSKFRKKINDKYPGSVKKEMPPN